MGLTHSHLAFAFIICVLLVLFGVCGLWFGDTLVNIKKQLAHFRWFWGLHTWIFALRAVFNVNARQLAVNERQCFLCGLWCAMFVNVFATASLWKWSLMACFARRHPTKGDFITRQFYPPWGLSLPLELHPQPELCPWWRSCPFYPSVCGTCRCDTPPWQSCRSPSTDG